MGTKTCGGKYKVCELPNWSAPRVRNKLFIVRIILVPRETNSSLLSVRCIGEGKSVTDAKLNSAP